ncbi:hypothetical protein EG328_009465 [Venturia inaequalis]|uniref:Cytochrome P450 monooxygenase n=1 Tax=Venturia inaequalis TaxID=5025 RepID=A0A8H3V897_VENIN|nr:hypothetical protein EG328_009465 [Venturia inaequalis]RDI87566.1 hypothetical protein Vi05172_g2288 [Venturia inaequalis]
MFSAVPPLLFDPLFVLGFALILGVAWQCSVYVYNVFLHPLSRFPGPKKNAASNWPYVLEVVGGTRIHYLHGLHQKYGDIVRIGPNELSFAGASTWKHLYGYSKPGKPAPYKDPRFYHFLDQEAGAHDMLTADDTDHSRMRRIFTHAFSTKALGLQESLLSRHVDNLIHQLSLEIGKEPNQVFNMFKWYGFTSFDIISDLAFGESLKLLERSSFTPWVDAIRGSYKRGSIIYPAQAWPWFGKIIMQGIKASPLFKKVMKDRMKHFDFSLGLLKKRLARPRAENDIWRLVVQAGEKQSLSLKEMHSNATLFMTAGTETTASTLSGITYLLTRNPEKLEKLQEELRTAFSSPDSVRATDLAQLKYLNAVISETLRIYPPVPTGLPRVVPRGGFQAGQLVIPGGTYVSQAMFASMHNEGNFRQADDFIPERWIGEDFATDRKECLLPFSHGPRNCLGQNLAWYELRFIVAKMFLHFDVTLCDDSRDWMKQKAYSLWDMGPLNCTLKRRQ